MFDRSAPTWVVQVVPSGTKKPLDVSDRVQSLNYEDNESKADKLTLTVLNLDLSNFDDPIWAKGNEVLVSWGYKHAMSPLRNCIISKVKGFEILTIEALGKELVMHTDSFRTVYENVKRSDVVREIAEFYGYGADLQHIEDTGVVRESILQGNMTDAQLVTRLAQAEGFVFFIDFDGFHFHKRKVGQRPVKTYTWRGGDGELLSVNVENDVTVKPGKVTVKGTDPTTGKKIEVSGSNDTTQRETLTKVIEIVDPETRTTKKVTQTTGGSGKATSSPVAGEKVVPTSGETATEAKKRADGLYRQVQQTSVELTLTALGDANVVAKSVVMVEKISKRLSGRYYLKEVKHSLSSGGYTMTMKAKTDGHNGYGTVGSVVPSQDPPSKGKANTKEAGSPTELTPFEKVDPETRTTKITFKDTRGRE